tara:strand:- start:6448 stop:6663 length:216 start_codon:yes stop_codon:yes gene_type:complete
MFKKITAIYKEHQVGFFYLKCLACIPLAFITLFGGSVLEEMVIKKIASEEIDLTKNEEPYMIKKNEHISEK